MGKSKAVRIISDELKVMAGILNSDEIDTGIILIETEDGEVNLSKFLADINGSEIDLVIRKKIEEQV